MNSKWRHDALRNTSVRKMVVWHNFWPYARLGPCFWVKDMSGKITTPTGRSANARLTIRALVADRSFLFIITASITKPFPRKIKSLGLLESACFDRLMTGIPEGRGGKDFWSGFRSNRISDLKRRSDLPKYGFSLLFLVNSRWLQWYEPTLTVQLIACWEKPSLMSFVRWSTWACSPHFLSLFCPSRKRFWLHVSNSLLLH